MRQQLTRLIVGFGVVFGVLWLSNVVSAQDGHGGVSNSYRGTADAYRQAAAQSPARASCYLQWAAYYDQLANYQTAIAPALDPGCSGGGSGDVGATAGAPITSYNPGNINTPGKSWLGAGLAAANQIANAWSERMRRQESERQRQSTDSDGSATGSESDYSTNNPMVDMYMQDFRRRTGGGQQSPDENDNGILLNYDGPASGYSGATAGPAGQRELDPFSEAEGIDRSNEPCVIDFPSGNTRTCTNKLEKQIDFSGAGSSRETLSAPPIDKDGIIQGGEFDLFQQVSRRLQEIARKQGLGKK
jgi:hypothetical protein